MEILPNEREMIRSVAETWKRQYYEGGRWGSTIDGSARTAYERLRKLDVETASSADVEAIIGTGGWTSHFCSECSSYQQPCIDLGYQGSSATVCLRCLRNALRMLKQTQAEAAK